jgi:hypothetical protein
MSTPELETELSLGNHKYRITRMSVFDQMQVASDFRDILVGLALLKRQRPKKMKDDAYNEALRMIIVSPAGIHPDTRQRVTSMCLRTILRQSNVGWQAIVASEDALQFDDIDLPELTKLLYAVFEHNKLLDFFSVSPSSLDGQKMIKDGSASEMERTS